jgi:outer membrane protein assembly factor BamB
MVRVGQGLSFRRGAILSIMVTVVLVAVLEAADQPGRTTDSARAHQILQASGVRGGLVVHLGCGDGKLTAALAAGGRYLVVGLDADAANVQTARRHIQSLSLYGPVSVDRLTGAELPYVDNLVNLVVAEDLGKVSTNEVMRVLAPDGVALIRGAGDQRPAAGENRLQIGGITWSKMVKPRPADIDDWTHYLHDASGNAVAADLEVGPPKHVRWVAGPLWSRSHEFNPSINAVVTGGGRMFYILDEGMTGLTDLRFPARWSLYARDAASGVFLWKRPLPNWGYREWNTRGMWSAPLTLNRRVVTDGRRVYVTLGYKAPVTVLDAATGQTLRTVPETDGTDEMILADGVLLLCVREQLSVASPPKPSAKRKQQRRLNPHEWTIGPPGPAAIVAVDAESGSVLWRSDPQPVVVLTLAASGGCVCYHDRQQIVCLDLKTGARRWATECRAMGGSRHSGGTLVMHDGVVLFTGAKGLAAFSDENGEKLWTGPRVTGPGITHPADLFVADGLVWGGDTPAVASRERTAVRRQGYDLRTGEVRRTIDVPYLFSPLHHVRCYRSKATDRYLMLPKRGIEFLDLRGNDHMRNDWVRPSCHYGVVPANGLLYVPPHHCFCYPGVKMTGFLALAAKKDEGRGASGEERQTPRLERGPAFPSEPIHPSSFILHPSDDWPTYRRDPLRSGHTPTAVPTALKTAWQTELGGKITPPVIAGGKVYIAQVDSHRVSCLDAASGEIAWTFTAGARVDSPPTILLGHAQQSARNQGEPLRERVSLGNRSSSTRRSSAPGIQARPLCERAAVRSGSQKGLVLFGCRDGWVYCLRAADGQLAWRFRAAPRDRRIVAFNQVESPWPVPGSVLVLDGVAYVSCGRSSFLDGGVFLYGLKPQTGEVLYQTRVAGPWPDVDEEVGRPFDMDGTKSDVLVTDGSNIYLFQMAFDKKLNDVTPPRASTLGDRKTGRHLVATGGFLDHTWFDRLFWMYGDRWPGFYFANSAPKAGQILVFDDETTYGLHVFTKRLRLSPVFTPGAEGYELFADDKENDPILAPNSVDREKGPGFSRAEPPKWSKQIPLRALAMVLAGDKLFMAGPPDVVPEDDPYAAFDGRLGARLWAVSAADGQKLAEYPLESLPVVDGLIASGGRLYLATADGKLRCFFDQHHEETPAEH